MSDSSKSFGAAFSGALEGTISVLLTLFVGYYVARKGLVDHKTVNRITRLCAELFLPCLIIVQMGPQLTAKKLGSLWILPLWGLASTLLAHLLGWFGQAVFRTRWWLIVAAGRPNSSALPLLLLQSLESTGILDALSQHGESAKDTLDRAKSLILLNVVVQQTFTFQIAPSVLKKDREIHGKATDEDDDPEGGNTLSATSSQGGNINPIIQDTERVGLLQDQDGRAYGTGDAEANYPEALSPIVDEPDIHWPASLGFMEQPVKMTISKMSPPLIGAIVALIIGLVPPLHDLFYSRDSPMYTSVTQSAQNLGELFVSLQMFTVGAELALVPHAKPGWIPTIYAMFIRFVMMPTLSLLFVWTTAGRDWYVNDELVWFLLILIPSGPSAMLLANVAELVDVDQGPVAAYLTISARLSFSSRMVSFSSYLLSQYFFSPLMAIVTSLALTVVEDASKRIS
ncbi:hypothetical protein EW026_g747 [Hermanssonia centrifuga]|uniref:PIN-like protein n=1 Tax=Hermanssonia centrifuga TaxID=98765 RepID=A0A4S4KUB6_9APHY|nr:hypothetical protein EW026_g747 [Hermanssonia centrifuga]